MCDQPLTAELMHVWRDGPLPEHIADCYYTHDPALISCERMNHIMTFDRMVAAEHYAG